ncbi:cell division protein FtsQ/DivIB [Patescibacteria group bacterium]
MKVYHGKSNRRGIRDYNRRKYGNPLFRKPMRGRKGKGPDLTMVRRWTMLAVAVVAVAAAVWYLFFSATFTVTSFELTGASSETEDVIRAVLEERLERRRLLVLPQSAIFLYDVGAAREDIREQFYLSRLEIRKRLPRDITVEVVERDAVAALISGGEMLALDSSGFVVRRQTRRERLSMLDLPDEFGAVAAGELGAEAVELAEMTGETEEDLSGNENPYPLIVDREEGEEPKSPGEAAVSTEALSLALQAYVRLPDVIGSGVRWFSMDVSADTVEITLREGWNVFMTTALPFDVQAERLALLLKEKIGGERPRLEYVDLRYDERIFFRYREGTPEIPAE